MGTPIHNRTSDPGPTGKISPPKVWGVCLMVVGVAPLGLFYAEIGPEVPAWTAFSMTVGMVLFGAGLYYGRGKGWARKAGDAFVDRVRGDDDHD